MVAATLVAGSSPAGEANYNDKTVILFWCSRFFMIKSQMSCPRRVSFLPKIQNNSNFAPWI